MKPKTPILILSIAAVALAVIASPLFFVMFGYASGIGQYYMSFEINMVPSGIINTLLTLAPAILVLVCVLTFNGGIRSKVLLAVIYGVMFLSALLSFYNVLTSLIQILSIDADVDLERHLSRYISQYVVNFVIDAVLIASSVLGLIAVFTGLKNKTLVIISFAGAVITSAFSLIAFGFALPASFGNGTYLLLLRSSLFSAKSIVLYTALFLIGLRNEIASPRKELN